MFNELDEKIDNELETETLCTTDKNMDKSRLLTKSRFIGFYPAGSLS